MCDEKVKTTANALKFYIKELEQKQKELDQSFIEQRKQYKSDMTKLEDEIKTASESLLVLESQLNEVSLPRIQESPEDPKDPTCPKCGNHTQRTKIKKVKGEKVQEWECLSCGQKFTAPMSVDGIPSDVGTRPGAGPKGPTGTHKRERYGVLDRARKFLDRELAKGRCILLQQIQNEADVSQSAAWRAACEVVKKDNSKYEFYKDPTTKFHLKGIRPIDSKKRRLFCPGCKTLLIPGKTCKKCEEES